MEYTVLQAPVSHFQLSLPPEVVVLSVTAPGLSRWTASPSGQLDLWSDHPVSGAWTTQIRYERATVRGDLPLPTLLGVTRETAYIGVDTRSALELVAGEARGATAIDVRELPPAITGRTDYPVLLAYRARGGEVHIPLDARTYDDLDGVLTLADTASAETVITPRRTPHHARSLGATQQSPPASACHDARGRRGLERGRRRACHPRRVGQR